MLTNFRTKQKQKISRNTQLSHKRTNERNKKSNVRMLFFVMFVNLVLCVDALMLGVFHRTIFFCFGVILLMKEK
jgi:cytoskeletal protein RodZ